ncbi:hypothetical protein Z517_12220 [Fonsecaea pedrosoi CBS 271.37]|uniref:Glycosyl hydrolase family 32 N-terminal domain-containing protein n=1 Tax=Fonsecaea pedrosoi CBS 271.37 TaxID=1442368 RepID=A0A0D2G6B5_9EURO|nr:uncharacterized protein Z517_12220 [Fonsecaea pedrosoi CBS 271.37]KIW74280.1 hypothetical protein Z517_12220 [Fonsecaea pedrosoi CBS 271.37]
MDQPTSPSPAFFRWRPQYHLQASHGWMNDPCAAAYDPSTGMYHLFFQWNPRRDESGSVVWGSICWGHATSTDMVKWNVSQTPSIEPGATVDEWYDAKGCFTGCLVPTNWDGEIGAGKMTIFYTGISRLPLHYTLPCIRQTETLAAAHSLDSGLTWNKFTKNPVLLEPPSTSNVTGWRDPFVAIWPSMANLLGHDRSQLYGMISGGIRDCSPAAFLYRVNPSDLAEWKFIGSLLDVGLNHFLSRWSGDLGINWECACFMTLQNEKDDESRDFIIVGCEGSQPNATHNEDSCFIHRHQQPTELCRTARSLQWMCGILQSTDDTISDTNIQTKLPKMDYQFGGRLDHGLLYAATTLRDPLSNKQIVWGWVTEEDLPQRLVDEQGWSGMTSLPREVTLLTLKGVTGTLRSRLQDVTSVQVEREESKDGEQHKFKIRTLSISPARCLDSLRNSARVVRPVRRSQHLNSTGDTFIDIQTHRFELISTFALSHACERIGLSIFHEPGSQEAQQDGIPPLLSSNTATTISFLPHKETVRIDRPITNTIDGEEINTAPEIAPFTLFTFLPDQRDEVGQVEAGRHLESEIENLELHLFFDESVLEVFVNSRCVITTRIYPPGKTCFGVRFWAEDKDGGEDIEDDSKQSSTPRQQEGGGHTDLKATCSKSQPGTASRLSTKSRIVQAMAWDGLSADVRNTFP